METNEFDETRFSYQESITMLPIEHDMGYTKNKEVRKDIIYVVIGVIIWLCLGIVFIFKINGVFKCCHS